MVSAIFFKLAMLSGPSWLMIPGKRSRNSVIISKKNKINVFLVRYHFLNIKKK
jgi:hypothetical protein